jgi:hypothetical protein
MGSDHLEILICMKIVSFVRDHQMTMYIFNSIMFAVTNKKKLDPFMLNCGGSHLGFQISTTITH